MPLVIQVEHYRLIHVEATAQRLTLKALLYDTKTGGPVESLPLQPFFPISRKDPCIGFLPLAIAVFRRIGDGGRLVWLARGWQGPDF